LPPPTLVGLPDTAESSGGGAWLAPEAAGTDAPALGPEVCAGHPGGPRTEDSRPLPVRPALGAVKPAPANRLPGRRWSPTRFPYSHGTGWHKSGRGVAWWDGRSAPPRAAPG